MIVVGNASIAAMTLAVVLLVGAGSWANNMQVSYVGTVWGRFDFDTSQTVTLMITQVFVSFGVTFVSALVTKFGWDITLIICAVICAADMVLFGVMRDQFRGRTEKDVVDIA